MKLQKMNTMELQRFFNSFHPRLSLKSIRLIHGTLRAAFPQTFPPGVSASRARSMRRPVETPTQDQGKFHVVQGRSSRQQVEVLKDESDFFIADAGQLIVVQFAHELSAHFS
jgi:hypothetical protein